MRPPTFLLRFARAVVGFVTLWCIGCSSYEPLVGSLLGEAGVMTCEGAMGVTAPSASQTSAMPTVSAASGAHDFDCGCGGSCHAPSPLFANVRAVHAPAPVVLAWAPATPRSVFRAPLLPPPEVPV